MANLIIFVDRLLYLYMYFIIFGCLLSWVPNLNPDYPLFHMIFVATGAYILPPIFGMLLGPCVVMLVLAASSYGLRKIYNKYYAEKERNILIITPEDLMKKLEMDAAKDKEKEQSEEEVPSNEDKENENDDK